MKKMIKLMEVNNRKRNNTITLGYNDCCQRLKIVKSLIVVVRQSVMLGITMLLLSSCRSNAIPEELILIWVVVGFLITMTLVLWNFAGQVFNEEENKQQTDPMVVSDEDIKRVYTNMDRAERIINLSMQDMDSMLILIMKYKRATLQEILDLQKKEFASIDSLSEPKIMTEVFLLYQDMKDILANVLNKWFFSNNIDLEYNLYLQTIDKVRNQFKRKAQNDLMLNHAAYLQKIDLVALKLTDLYTDFLFYKTFQQLIDETCEKRNEN